MSLMEFAKRREKKKLIGLKLMHEYTELFCYPILQHLKAAYEEILKADSKRVFYLPVNTDIVRDYLTYIKEPMSFYTIETKLNAYGYSDFEALEVSIVIHFTNNVV